MITLSNEIKAACPGFAGVAVYAEVINTAYSEGNRCLYPGVDFEHKDGRYQVATCYCRYA